MHDIEVLFFQWWVGKHQRMAELSHIETAREALFENPNLLWRTMVNYVIVALILNS